MDNHLKTALWGRDAVLFCYHAEVVAAWLHVAEGNLVDSWWHAHPVFLVDAVAIDDMLWVVVGQRRQLYGEGVVAAAEYETVGGDDGGICHLPYARHGSFADGLAVDGESGQFYVSLPLTLTDVGRVEPCDTAQSGEDEVARR